MKLMKAAAGRSFFEHVCAEAKEVVPDLRWVLTAADGSWSESPEDCELVVLAGDAYTSAFVVLALPFTAENRGLVGKAELALMKKTATLINVARGALVDVEALKKAFRAGQLRHACLDVLPTEPWPADDELWDMPRVLLTPHNAWSSPLYLPRVAQLWLANLRRYVRGDELLHRIS